MISGRGVQRRQPTPYRPIAEALLAACRRLGLPADAELIPYRPALGRLLPEWHQPDLTGSSASTVVIGEGVLRLLKALHRGRGLLLVVEDVQWTDPETRAVLEYVVDHALEERLAVVATARPDPSAGVDLLRDLVGRRAATLVELTPLPAAEVAAMALSSLETQALPPGCPRCWPAPKASRSSSRRCLRRPSTQGC